MMRFLITLEQCEAGFGVQVPDLAIVTWGEDIEAAKRAAREAILANLDAYEEAGRQAPSASPVLRHLENPDFEDLLFAYVDVATPHDRMAA
jgi:predicted RNase H-like HicB family nuclease